MKATSAFGQMPEAANTARGMKNAEVLASSDKITFSQQNRAELHPLQEKDKKELSQIQNWVQNQENEMHADSSADPRNRTSAAHLSFKMIQDSDLVSQMANQSEAVVRSSYPEHQNGGDQLTTGPSELIKRHIEQC